MTRFDKFVTSSVDSLAQWIDENAQHDDSPWMNWFENKYCRNCESVKISREDSLEKLGFELLYLNDTECSYCEINKQCRYFPDREESPSVVEIIKMWLESEVEE